MAILRLVCSLLILAAWPVLADFPDEDDPDLAALKAQIETDQAGAKAAIPVLEDALEDAPQDADVLTMLGYAHRKAGDYAAARPYYETALTISPRNIDALEYLGEMEVELGNIVAARRLLFKLVAVCPGCEEREELEDVFRARGLDPTGEGYE